MQKIIAVILDDTDLLSEMKDAKKLSVYHKTGQEWTWKEEVILPDMFTGSMSDIRKKLEDVIKELKDCKIIVGKSITGLVYNVFNNAGFIISEADGFHVSILDELYADVLEEMDALKAEKELNNVPTSPVETEIKGNYFFDFDLLKKSDLPYTSKNTILPFLNTTPFCQLEILCDHVMPWFESEMKKRNLTYTVTELGERKCSVLVKTVNG
ncbi:MAG: Fe-only nitrogenase accessory AnfO family protein [Anaerocolumna sp.]